MMNWSNAPPILILINTMRLRWGDHEAEYNMIAATIASIAILSAIASVNAVREPWMGNKRISDIPGHTNRKQSAISGRNSDLLSEYINKPVPVAKITIIAGHNQTPSVKTLPRWYRKSS